MGRGSKVAGGGLRSGRLSLLDRFGDPWPMDWICAGPLPFSYAAVKGFFGSGEENVKREDIRRLEPNQQRGDQSTKQRKLYLRPTRVQPTS